MKKIFAVLLLVPVVLTGCAHDNLEDLHLVSTQELSEKRKAAMEQAKEENEPVSPEIPYAEP